ncbi:MAG TPA: circadian clock protein KaiC [Steroidobacteraceae bacterium]|nr:circadian clock protein KaiC [Steroidobacteraceae bacterium]
MLDEPEIAERLAARMPDPSRPGTDDPERALPKVATGIAGLDEVLRGGLPAGRPTLVCGGAGCGKTLMSMEFLVRGALEFGEPGAYISFEETEHELSQNVRSLGFDVDALVREGKLVFDHVRVERQEIEEIGEYDLDGLFVRLGLAIDAVGARRVVLDTIESLFSGFSDMAVLRSELRRLFAFLKARGVTTIVTGERGDGTLTRQGLEEYVSDCVILLDHRVHDQVSTRRLRVVKYRGTAHGTNEYPFLIDEDGFSVLPLTSIGLGHTVSDERITTGIRRLDNMLGGQGYYRGSTILISGTAGSGKTSLAAHFATSVCARGERCLYLAFEESPDQITRNMRSIGLDMATPVRQGLLRIESARPTLHGLEMHLAQIHRAVEQFDPHAIVIDPISNLSTAGVALDATAMLLRLIDFLKVRGTTALLVSLTGGEAAIEVSGQGVSSLIDTWLILRDLEAGGERNRGLYVIKSRGMAHSNQIREFLITNEGIQLQDVYVGPEGVLTGSLRAQQEARERAAAVAREQDARRRQRDLQRRRAAVEAQIAALQAEFAALDEEGRVSTTEHDARSAIIQTERDAAAGRRGADTAASAPGSNP